MHGVCTDIFDTRISCSQKWHFRKRWIMYNIAWISARLNYFTNICRSKQVLIEEYSMYISSALILMWSTYSKKYFPNRMMNGIHKINDKCTSSKRFIYLIFDLIQFAKGGQIENRNFICALFRCLHSENCDLSLLKSFTDGKIIDSFLKSSDKFYVTFSLLCTDVL